PAGPHAAVHPRGVAPRERPGNCGRDRAYRILWAMPPEPLPGRAPAAAAVNDVPLPIDYSTEHAGRVSRQRWVVLALVFFAITINYIDRNVMGLVAPGLRQQFNIGAKAYGYVTASFALSYALGQAMSGRWLDWIGTRVGYAVALAACSVASMLHAFAGSALGVGLARALLGITESPAYPAATKTLAECLPKTA